MYEDLVKSLRTCARDGDCRDCKMFVQGGDCGAGLFSLMSQAADAIDELGKKVERTSHIYYVEFSKMYGDTKVEYVAFYDERNITEQQVREAIFGGIEGSLPWIAAMSKKVAQNVFGLNG